MAAKMNEAAYHRVRSNKVTYEVKMF